MGKCCSNPRTHEKCRNHPNNMLTLFCVEKSCMEPLCSQCKDTHKKFHSQNNESCKIMDIRDIEDYQQSMIDLELKSIRNYKDRIHSPEQYLYRQIDRYFYGAAEQRESKLSQYKSSISENYTANKLVKIIEDSHQYSLKPDFKVKYWAFLEQLSNQARSRNPPTK